MTPERRLEILRWIDVMLYWHDSVTLTEKQQLIEEGFVVPEGDAVLTSLGELEIGYPETN